MDNLIINRQWSSRPADERFIGLDKAHAFNLEQYHKSRQGVVDLVSLEAIALEDDPTGQALAIVNKNKGTSAAINNWAFNQLLGQRLEIPPSYISRLPAKLASANINWAIEHAPKDKVNLLVTNMADMGSDPAYQIRSVTSETYGRIWNYQITGPLLERFGDGLTGEWRVPGEFGKDVPITKDNTTIYSGTQDMFVCLVNEHDKIELPNRRNGKSSMVSRGFIVTNSEVGAGVVAVYFFTFDYICRNRTIWGLGDVKEIKLRHSKFAPETWMDEIAPAIEYYGQTKVSDYEQKLLTAQNTKLEVPAFDFLKAKLPLPPAVKTDKLINGILQAYKDDEAEILEGKVTEDGKAVIDFRPMETVFDVTVGVTAYARKLEWQNERVPLERAAGQLLASV